MNKKEKQDIKDIEGCVGINKERAYALKANYEVRDSMNKLGASVKNATENLGDKIMKPLCDH